MFYLYKLIFCLYKYFLCQRRYKHFDIHYWRIKLVLFPSKDGKEAAYEGRIG